MKRKSIGGSISNRRNSKKFAKACIICCFLLTAGFATYVISMIESTAMDDRLVSSFDILDLNQDPLERRIALRAYELLPQEKYYDLADMRKITSSFSGDCNWFFEFQDWKGNTVYIELDAADMSLIFLSDCTNTNENPIWKINDNEALDISQEYISDLIENGWLEVRGKLIPEVTKDLDAWKITFSHYIQNVYVLHDYISMRINPETKAIISYSSSIANIDSIPDPVIESSDAISYLSNLTNYELCFEDSVTLGIVEQNEHYIRNTELVWIICEQESPNEYWISAYTNEYVGSNCVLSYGSSHSMGMNIYFPWQPEYYNPEVQWAHIAAESIYNRLEYNNYDSIYEKDTLSMGLTAALSTQDVVYFIGHGDWSTWLGGLGPNHLCCGPIPYYTGQYFGDESMPLVIDSTLFFAAACGSGLGGWHSIAENAISRGCDCYCGFTDDVTMGVAWPFSEYFFDFAVNGKTFTQCKDYAIQKTGISQSDFALFGDGSLSLSCYDSAPSFSLSSQRYNHFVGTTGWGTHVGDEPLWGGDIDSFRTTVSGDHEVALSVFASYAISGCIVKVTVYYWKHGNNIDYWSEIRSNQGGSVSVTLTSPSTREYLIVIEHADGHGGWYTLNFNPVVS